MKTYLEVAGSEESRRLREMSWLVHLLKIVGLAEVGMPDLHDYGYTKIDKFILLIVFGSLCLFWDKVVRAPV